VVSKVNSFHHRLRGGYCDPAEHDVVQGVMGVEPGLARHRRSALRAGWSFPVRQLFHFVNNASQTLAVASARLSTLWSRRLLAFP